MPRDLQVQISNQILNFPLLDEATVIFIKLEEKLYNIVAFLLTSHSDKFVHNVLWLLFFYLLRQKPLDNEVILPRGYVPLGPQSLPCYIKLQGKNKRQKLSKITHQVRVILWAVPWLFVSYKRRAVRYSSLIGRDMRKFQIR